MARILVSEELAEGGLNKLRAAGHEVDVQTGLTPEQLHAAIKGAHALIVRSATQVDRALLNAADSLVVVGRAGVGLDNVDVETATARGVMVANAPESNIVSAAEHTMAMLMAVARNVPQAHAALVQGRWERSKWEGVELFDKVLGVVGLGRIGKLVAQRAAAFGMRIVAFDPFVSEERARAMNIELLDLDTLVARADFITIHLPKNKETVGLFDAAMFKKAKPSQRNHCRRRARRVRQGAHDRVAALRRARHRGHPAPRRQHDRGAGPRRSRHRRPDHPRARG